MSTWVVIVINSVLLGYSAFMFVFGTIKKRKRIEKAKEELRKEFENEIQNQSKQQ